MKLGIDIDDTILNTIEYMKSPISSYFEVDLETTEKEKYF